jgi:Zn-dependent protease
MPNFLEFLLLLPPILAALTIHEYSHGWMAYRFGDPTAKDAGRLTLNPLKHLDLVGTVLLFLVHFGWAKPVPVDVRYFANPRRDMIWVALAGPGANIALALLCGLVLQILYPSSMLMVMAKYQSNFAFLMLSLAVYINLTLALFNMIPIPPLDGSRVVEGLLPVPYLEYWFKFARFGGIALFALVLLGRFAQIDFFKFIMYPATLLYLLFTNGAPSPF